MIRNKTPGVSGLQHHYARLIHRRVHCCVHHRGAAAPGASHPARGALQEASPWLRQTQTKAASGAASFGGSAEPNEPVAAAHGATAVQTLFNYVNVIMGAGFVSIPYACRIGGWAALLILWLLGLAFAWTGLVVLDCCKRVDAQAAASPESPGVTKASPRVTKVALQPAGYEDVAEAAFGQLGRRIISGVMYAELLGICTVYLVLEAQALAALFGSSPPIASLRHTLPAAISDKLFGLIAALVVVPTVLLPDLAALSGLGALSVGSAVAVGLALACLFLGGAPAAATAPVVPELLPQVLGCVAFVYAGHSTFPVVQQSMRRPSQALGVLKLAYFCVAAICTLVGGFGYILYGPAAADVITTNLPAGSFLGTICLLLTAVSPFAAFAVTLEPVALALQKSFGKGSGSSSGGGGASAGSEVSGQPPYPVRAAVRLGIAFACAAAALSLPYVADLMSLVGALLTMSISLVVPALMQLRLEGEGLGPLGVARAVGVLLLGVVCASVGASSATGSLRAKMAAASSAAAGMVVG